MIYHFHTHLNGSWASQRGFGFLACHFKHRRAVGAERCGQDHSDISTLIIYDQVSNQAELDDIETDLLAMDRIDLYAYVNPVALTEVTNRHGDHAALPEGYLERIGEDWRVSGELADVAIENLFNIDPGFIRAYNRARNEMLLNVKRRQRRGY